MPNRRSLCICSVQTNRKQIILITQMFNIALIMLLSAIIIINTDALDEKAIYLLVYVPHDDHFGCSIICSINILQIIVGDNVWSYLLN